MNTLFVFSCLAVCALSLVYFFYDLNKVSFKPEVEIAFVQFKQKLAQRRFSDSVVWERLVQNSPLYDEDLISTDSGALAIVSFKTGTKINIDENSMIQIFEKKDGELSLNVESGNVDIDTTSATKKITVDFENGYKVELDTGSKISASSNQKTTDFVIHQGTVKSVNKDGSENLFTKGQSLKIDDSGNTKQNLISTKDFSANQKVYINENSSKTIDFNFNVDSSVKNQAVIFETSDFDDFSIIKFSKEIKDSVQVEVTDSEEDFYYRAYLKANKENITSGKVTLVKVETPKIEQTETVPVFETTENSTNVFLKWETQEQSDYSIVRVYKIYVKPGIELTEQEIESQLTNENLVFEKQVTKNAITVPSLNAGSYAYKVSAHYPTVAEDIKSESDAQVFYVEQVEKTLPKTSTSPILEITLDTKIDEDLTIQVEEETAHEPAKAEISEVSKIDEKPEIAKVEQKTEQAVKVAEKPQESAKTEKREVSKAKEPTKQAEKPAQIAEPEKPTIMPLTKPVLVAPTNNFVVSGDYLGRNRKISFEWQSVENATEYLFTLFQKQASGSTKQLFTETVNSASYDFTNLPLLDVGQFQWEIQALQKDEAGTVVTASEKSASVFEINFDLPTDVEADDQGTMYGN